MTTKTVILMKVFPSPELDIVTNNCPIISHPSWQIVPYVCKSVRTVDAAGRWSEMCGQGVGLTPATVRNETLGNDDDYGRQGASISANSINHIMKCQRAVRRLGPQTTVCACVWCTAKGNVYKYPKMQKLYGRDLHLKIIYWDFFCSFFFFFF